MTSRIKFKHIFIGFLASNVLCCPFYLPAEPFSPLSALSSIKVHAQSQTITVTDIHGTVSVPLNPKSVVALDNRTFKTLEDWGITLSAAPKAIMPKTLSYVNDEHVLDIGSHREPNLEMIAAANPDLVIIGQRFQSYYDDIKTLVPNAAIVDFSFDVSEQAQHTSEALMHGLTDTTLTLGKIFNKNSEAEALVTEFNQAIEAAKTAYNANNTIMSVVVSGGDIGFSAPNFGRFWGPLYAIFDWQSSLSINHASSDHKGDDISVEAIAQSNPDWILVLDRDASVVKESDYVPASDVIEKSPALQSTNAVKHQHIIYAPADTYVNESIQTYIHVFNQLAQAFSGK